MTSIAARTLGSRRLGAMLLSVSLIGSLFVPTTVLAVGPSVTINRAVGQEYYTGASPINFTVVFSDPVEGFTSGDVIISGDAGGTKIATVTGGPKTYNVAVTGMTTGGVVFASVPAGAAYNPADEPNLASTVSFDSAVFWRPGGPSVTINQAAGQADPTGTSPINFTVVFSAGVVNFYDAGVVLSGTAGGELKATVTGSGTTHNVAVTGMTTSGTVIATVRDGAAVPGGDGPSLPSLPSTSTDNTVTWAPVGPSVTINQAADQADPTGTSPIGFTAVFSASVTGFASGDVTISGTAGGTKTATVTGSGTTYNVTVTGMTTAGTVVATVPKSVAVDIREQGNLASVSSDNTVTWAPVAGAITLTTSAPIPPGAKDPVILWGQGFTLAVQFGTNGASKAFELQGTRDGAAWTTISTQTTDANGRASLFYRPVTNLFYRAVFAGTPDLAASTSNQVRTVVRQLAVMRPTNAGSTRSISRNTSITFTTTVRPARPELAPARVSFLFYRQVAGAWQLATKRDVVVDGAGLARTTFTFTSAGSWRVRSQANPTTYNANSILTQIESYSVR